MRPSHEAVLAFLSNLNLHFDDPLQATFKLGEDFTVGFLEVGPLDENEASNEGEGGEQAKAANTLLMIVEFPISMALEDYANAISEKPIALKINDQARNVHIATAVTYDDEKNPFFVMMAPLPQYAYISDIEDELKALVDFANKFLMRAIQQ